MPLHDRSRNAFRVGRRYRQRWIGTSPAWRRFVRWHLCATLFYWALRYAGGLARCGGELFSASWGDYVAAVFRSRGAHSTLVAWGSADSAVYWRGRKSESLVKAGPKLGKKCRARLTEMENLRAESRCRRFRRRGFTDAKPKLALTVRGDNSCNEGAPGRVNYILSPFTDELEDTFRRSGLKPSTIRK